MPTKRTKREDGRFQVSVTIGRDKSGRLKRKVFYGKTQKEACEKRDQFLKFMSVNRTDKMSIARWSEIWMQNYAQGGYRHKQNTQSILNVFLKSLCESADLPISELRPVDIQYYATSLKKCSQSHVNKCKYVITQLFKSAQENHYIASSPCTGIVWSGVENNTRESIDDETIMRITKKWNVHPAGTWAMFVLYAGLRPSEAFALQRDHIDEQFIHITDGSHFEHGQLVIMPGKTKSNAGQRSIPILPPLRPVIASLPASGLVCTSTKGKVVSQSAYKRNWEAFCNQAGISTDMYSLRHTFCSMLYDAGVDVKTAQILMGHSDLEVTMKIYTHLSEKKKAQSFDSLINYFKK